MGEQAEALKERTRRFALAILRLVKHLPHEEPGPLIRRQLAKSATSVSMNDRARCRARSHAEFTAKIGLVDEEADETLARHRTSERTQERQSIPETAQSARTTQSLNPATITKSPNH